MRPYWTDGQVSLYLGDCLDVLASLPGASTDAVVTDPPYGLEFMGREWDGADGFRRSLNPADAGRGDVFGRTSRTSPEYRTGKPSSARIRERVDGRTNPAAGKSTTRTPEAYVAGPVFQEWCEAWASQCLRLLRPGGYLLAFGGTRTYHRLVCAIEDAGFEIRDSLHWIYGSGFPKGNACLKPSHEPIVLARKPAAKSAPLNIDACRLAGDEDGSRNRPPSRLGGNATYAQDEWTRTAIVERRDTTGLGRWPPNVLLSPDAAAELDAQSGTLHTHGGGNRVGPRSSGSGWRMGEQPGIEPGSKDSGGASRFFPVFRYQAKAPSSERPRLPDGTAWPTVKPLSLMRWLTRLITPAGGTVLDPFAGTGTTAEACIIEGYDCLLIERDPQAAALIERRLAKPIQPVLGDSA